MTGNSAQGRRAVVAMSGGVDSSVTAGLMMEAGYEVVGITMQLYDRKDTGLEQSGSCCSLDDVHDARRVAEELGIPHYVVNFEAPFRKLVVDDLTQAYLQGRTPNPCVRCNEWMKFRLLLKRSLALGGDFLATGHYARVDFHQEEQRYRLLKGVDPQKDQTYFLYPVEQEQLARLRFPLGGMTKAEVRVHAERLGLPTARKRESQDVCFVAGERYTEFMERSVGPDGLPGEGEIVDEAGQVLGRHPGHHRFTVGQRKGIGIAGKRPLYVRAVNAANNQVVVAPQDRLYSQELLASQLYWPAGGPPSADESVMLKVRYRSEPVPGRVLAVENGQARFRFDVPVKAVAPGQSVVAYRGDETLGGGIIERVGQAGEEVAWSAGAAQVGGGA